MLGPLSALSLGILGTTTVQNSSTCRWCSKRMYHGSILLPHFASMLLASHHKPPRSTRLCSLGSIVQRPRKNLRSILCCHFTNPTPRPHTSKLPNPCKSWDHPLPTDLMDIDIDLKTLEYLRNKRKIHMHHIYDHTQRGRMLHLHFDLNRHFGNLLGCHEFTNLHEQGPLLLVNACRSQSGLRPCPSLRLCYQW